MSKIGSWLLQEQNNGYHQDIPLGRPSYTSLSRTPRDITQDRLNDVMHNDTAKLGVQRTIQQRSTVL